MTKTRKNSALNMMIVLVGVCFVSAAVLGAVHSITEEKIKENKKKVIKEAVFGVLPGITSYEKINAEPVIFRGKTENSTAGYAVLAEGMGFQGYITLMVGVGPDLDIMTGVIVLDSVETPGLGDRIKGDDFCRQFRKMNVPLSDGIKVNAITGATISSVAVEKIVNRALEDVKRIR
ncbi:MAG: FMN-binding protein [Elusimicrobiota bacterium]